MSARDGPPPCPFGASAYARSVHGYFGTATWRSSTGRLGSRECGNVQRAWLACSQLSPPPYEPPVTAIRLGSTSGNVAATSAASHWVSRTSQLRLLMWIVPAGGPTEVPLGVSGW